MALADHFGQTPTTVCNAVISALSIFKMANGVGPVKTIKRLVTADDEAMDRQLALGLPAFLVVHLAGEFKKGRASGQAWDQECVVSIFCCAGSFESQSDRLEGGVSALTDPGVENLVDWATYYGVQGIAALEKIRSVRPLNQRWHKFEPGKYIMTVDIAYTRTLDAWMDDPTTLFESLGIIHDPIDPDDLWEVDNETPKSEWPPTVDGGVVDVT